MHEMGLAQGILEVVLDAAAGEKVRRISLRVGRGQMVKPDSLEFSFRLVSEGTSAAEAAFALKEVPIRLRCRQCAAETGVDFPPWNCRRCGGSDVEILSGDEFLVDAVELESGRIIARRDEDGR
ncbi:MAG: hydrogenase maturation nickel metallochaperone HypA [Candidatus Binatia bacterium]